MNIDSIKSAVMKRLLKDANEELIYNGDEVITCKISNDMIISQNGNTVIDFSNLEFHMSNYYPFFTKGGDIIVSIIPSFSGFIEYFTLNETDYIPVLHSPIGIDFRSFPLTDEANSSETIRKLNSSFDSVYLRYSLSPTLKEQIQRHLTCRVEDYCRKDIIEIPFQKLQIYHYLKKMKNGIRQRENWKKHGHKCILEMYAHGEKINIEINEMKNSVSSTNLWNSIYKLSDDKRDFIIAAKKSNSNHIDIIFKD